MNERSTEGGGACWEGVEMTTTPDQFVYVMCCSMYTAHMLLHMVCGIRVRTEVMGLDPPQSVG